ncbi:MAG: hypothetical protein HY363_03250 [Candidatus Aenigmarchaeota archaeon]|nr:hypothetical protein [Candidatus Aenigmarchaeota archaeon]
MNEEIEWMIKEGILSFIPAEQTTESLRASIDALCASDDRIQACISRQHRDETGKPYEQKYLGQTVGENPQSMMRCAGCDYFYMADAQ